MLARLERLEGGALPVPSPRPVLPPRALPTPAPAPKAPPPAVAASPRPEPIAGDAASLLGAMIQAARPSLSQALRSASAAFDGDVLVLSVAPDFAAFASTHGEEYEALASQAAGRKLKVRVAKGAAPAASAAAAAPSEAEESRQKMRKDAEQEPAVQEALDLFGGTVVDVREAKG
jgi:DNA polymerase-3 subunit gamma/tau